MDKDSFDTLLDNLQCSLCCLAMLPPLREPMIIPECGHTICKSCLSKLKECPYCHHAITKPVKNILVLQILDSLNSQNLIPDWLNPPPPAENKLIPKIIPLCTLTASGKKYINQKFFKCRTCKIEGNFGFCEACARMCHKGHDIYLNKSSTSSYCDCKKFRKCQCLLQSDSLRCTFELTYGTPIDQPMYQCKDCHIEDNYFICQNCAVKCHQGHNLIYFNNVKGKQCRCLDQGCCQIAFRDPICTFLSSGKKYIKQPWFYCKTCNFVDEYGCCSVCARRCHKDHDIEFKGVSEECYCDCGDGHGDKCHMLEYANPSYLTTCTNFSIINKDHSIKQRMYNCATCGASGICEACAINSHINHSIQFVGFNDFCCQCISTNKCIMLMVPMLHNGRTKCDRLVLDHEDISACYACYTCDKSGNKKLCETCALKKHKSHDIHLISYTKFSCNENDRVPKKKAIIFKPKCTPQT